MRNLLLSLVLCCGIVTSSFAQSPRFAVHAINAEAEFPACAVLDVNHDGKLDIVSGGFWYEGPQWKRHFVRDVEVIRGRFDDYSNLPLDVNGDGWLDTISVNYRSKSAFWIEHPGETIKSAPDTPWEKHLIDSPGTMETGRLEDIDGDGRLDILPNGTGFACWYELSRDKTADGQPKWLKHDLPSEVAGHGVGFGDVNGDGRGDVVGPSGWLEAPGDRRSGRWLWHEEFDLFRDTSIPILVKDVEGDGDADLIWGRGHHTGLYWLEQAKVDGQRTWTMHAIDTSWSQPHSILLADLDGDGQAELIAGKRYMGHEGNDPGEWDPLCVFGYTFHKDSRTWSRFEISRGGGAGFGLDPKAADVDGDGDLDLVGGDRSGLYLIENLGPVPTPAPPAFEPYPDHSQLLVYRDGSELKSVANAKEFGQRRADILLAMEQVMGPLPNPFRRVPLDVQIESEEQKDKYTQIKLTYAAEPGDRVPALLLVPNTLRDKSGEVKAKAAAMLCLHPTNADGKAQTAGLVGEQTRHYGKQLAELGYICLIPDYPSFGDYKEYDFHQPDSTNPKQPLYVSGTMKAIWNNVRALDLLESLPYVEREQIGCIGHSLGGHNALFTAAFDLRIKAVVTSCGFTGFADYYKGDLAGWTSDRYMPRIRDVYAKDPAKMPFDFPEVLAAIAPRPIFVAAPLADANFDNAGVRKVIASVTPVYELLGAKGNLHAIYPDCKHDFPDDARAEVYAWLGKQLSGKTK
jgi:dienelactone hydrolase